MNVEVLNTAIILSVGLVLYIAMMARVRTKAGRSLAFVLAMVFIAAPTMFIFGAQQDLLGVIVASIFPLIGAAVGMRALNRQGVSPFVWGIGAFLGGAAGSAAGLYLGLMVACRGEDC